MTGRFPLWLAAAFVALALIYAAAIPIFETPDEAEHFAVIDYIASTGALPVQVVGAHTRYEQEGSQPPLFYMLAAALVGGLERSDLDELRQRNPHAIIGDPSARGNQNFMLHNSPYPPRFDGARAAVYAARALSIALGAITVVAVYQTARALLPERRNTAMIAAGLAAFNPQFLFISASVNNDNLVTAINSVVLWQALVMVRVGFDTRRSILLGVLAALATVSKLSGWVGVAITAAAGLATLYHAGGCDVRAWRSWQWRGLFTLAAALALSWLLLAGWWYARNLTLYGEFFGTHIMLDIFGRRPAPALPELLNEFTGLRMSFWGLFGHFNVFMFPPFYAVMDGLALLGAAGALEHMWRERHNTLRLMQSGLLLLALGVALAGLLSWTMQTAASQGRLLFPVMAAICGLLALGLTTLRVPTVVVAVMTFFAVAAPVARIVPTYAPPPALTALPPDAEPAHIHFGDTALVGYQIAPRRYQAGESVPITLYWQPTRPADADYSLFIRLIDLNDDIVSVLPTYPGYGRLRTSAWQAGAIYADHYDVPLPNAITGAFALRAHVGWWKFPEGYALDPTNAAGEMINQVVLEVGGVVETHRRQQPMDRRVEGARFGEAIDLLGYSLIDDELLLLWECVRPLTEDFTVMVFALANPYDVNGNNVILAQGDAPPSLPTRYWQVGDQFVTRHEIVPRIALLQGEFPLYVGWYSTEQPLRLTIDYLDNAYPLGMLTLRANDAGWAHAISARPVP